MARPYDPTGRAAKSAQLGRCGNEIALLEIAITARYGAAAG